MEGAFNVKRVKLKDIKSDLDEKLKPADKDGKKHTQPVLLAVRYVIFNGLLLNIIFTGLFGFPFNALTLLACGLAWWYFREELVEWIRLCRQ